MAEENIVPLNQSLSMDKFSQQKELIIIDAQVKIKQAQTALAQETVSGVISVIKDLVEVKKINDQGRIQIAVMQEQGELIRRDLESFREKNTLTRNSFQEKAVAMKYFLGALNEQLSLQNLSDTVKVATIKCYETTITELLKS